MFVATVGAVTTTAVVVRTVRGVVRLSARRAGMAGRTTLTTTGTVVARTAVAMVTRTVAVRTSKGERRRAAGSMLTGVTAVVVTMVTEGAVRTRTVVRAAVMVTRRGAVAMTMTATTTAPTKATTTKAAATRTQTGKHARTFVLVLIIHSLFSLCLSHSLDVVTSSGIGKLRDAQLLKPDSLRRNCGALDCILASADADGGGRTTLHDDVWSVLAAKLADFVVADEDRVLGTGGLTDGLREVADADHGVVSDKNRAD